MHRIAWSLAMAAALAAVLAVGLRDRDRHRVEAGDLPAASAVDEAVRRLEADPAAWELATQAVVRAAAVQVEAGAERSAEGYYVLGFQYARERNLSQAETMYRRAMVLRPEWPWPYVGLGTLLGRQSPDQREEALGLLQEATQLAPGWHQAHDVLAQVLRAAGRLEEARAAAELALELRPDDIATQNNYANLLVALEDYAGAEQHYRRAIELGPDHPKPYYNLACVYTLMGRLDDAVRYLEQSIRLAPVLRAQARQDHDLDGLREHPGFRSLMNLDAPPAGT
jgi:tetratricopeptide (TPR) repeat protein